MLLGVLSDTHGSTAHTLPAVRMLQALGVERVLHCGDIGSPEVVRLLADWPVDYVYGNCDHNRAQLRAAVEGQGQTWRGAFADLEVAGVRVALLHGDDTRRLREAVARGGYGLVCSGHTHVASIQRVGATLALNPGACYRANPPSVAVVELPAAEATIVPL